MYIFKTITMMRDYKRKTLCIGGDDFIVKDSHQIIRIKPTSIQPTMLDDLMRFPFMILVTEQENDSAISHDHEPMIVWLSTKEYRSILKGGYDVFEKFVRRESNLTDILGNGGVDKCLY